MRFRFIEDHRDKFPTRLMCSVLLGHRRHHPRTGRAKICVNPCLPNRCKIKETRTGRPVVVMGPHSWR